MKIICFIVVLIKITKEANSLKCHVNEKGAEPKEETCKTGEDEWCNYSENKDGVIRKCKGKKDDIGWEIKEGCIKTKEFKIGGRVVPETTTCACNSNNCNNNCIAGDKCTEVTVPEDKIPQGLPKDFKYEQCDSKCQAEGGGQGTDSKATEQSGGATGKPESGTGESGGATGEPESGTGESGGATGEPASGTGGTQTGGCKRIRNSFEKIILFWIIASLVISIEIY